MESRCRYTRINGARCAMPALNGHELCYEHHERKRQAQRKPAPADPQAPGPLVNLVYMDDHASVLANLNAIAEAFVYGHIDNRQLNALTRLMQTCLKTLHQKHERHYYESPDDDDPVCEVTYDEDGLALAVDPIRRKKAVSNIRASAAPEPACATAEPLACPTPEIASTTDPESPVTAAPHNQQATSFQTLTPKSKDKPPVINHLPHPPKTSPLFSNTSLRLDADDSLRLAIDAISAWNPHMMRSILNTLRQRD
jgi:hypothetical protein